ncbi:MAG TPA: porin family protein [Brevundimonas sp.]|uniref:porin family protein n=1 Tax=Brevundimonas sp. TaxID=1871086 RepID=UPI002C8A55CE|nr:porin family protein [Brevundimonas sp.]HRH21177.1 porin family protein [Brevundimonas sp.]
MRTLAFTTVVAVAATIAVPAAAQSLTSPSWYGSVGYSNLSSDDTDVSLDALTGRVGARFSPYFGAEGELSVGLGDETLVPGVDVQLNHDAAVYGVASYPIAQNIEVFGRLGYGTTEMEASGLGTTATEHSDSWNYGVGANYLFDGVNGVRADYTRRDYQDDNGEADVWTVSYVRRF